VEVFFYLAGLALLALVTVSILGQRCLDCVEAME